MGELEVRLEERPYWETIDYTGANRIVQGNIKTGQQAAITMGYYLKRIRDEKLYLEGGYQNFGEYAKAECGMSESAASRNISRMELFSEGGNSPKLADKYAAYSSSKLQEMITMSEDQLAQVTPDMTVAAMRALKSPEPETEPEEETITATIDLSGDDGDGRSDDDSQVAPDEEGDGPAKCITGLSGSGICGGAAYCTEPYTCCAECENDCNSRCGWLDQDTEVPSGPVVIEGKVEEILPDVEDDQAPAEVHDERWFTLQICERFSYGEKAVMVCSQMIGQAPGEIAKAIQRTIAPCGYASRSSGGFRDPDRYSLTFNSFSAGIDCELGSEKMHLKYGRFTKEIIGLIEDGTISVPEDPETNCKHDAGGICEVLSDIDVQQPCVEGPCLAEELATSQEADPSDGSLSVTDCSDNTGSDLAELDQPERKPNPGMVSAARNSLSNLRIEIDAKAWEAALASARHLVHYLEVITGNRPTPKNKSVWPEVLSDIPHFTPLAIKDHLNNIEHTMDEFIEFNANEPDTGKRIPERTIAKYQIIVGGMRLLMQVAEEWEKQEDNES